MRSILTLFLLLILPCVPLHAEENDAGRQLFEFRCGMCHQLPDPDALKPAQWRALLQTMQTRMKQFNIPPLNEAEFEKVLAYLIANARKEP
jgi:mono/diheme cytochrome c family protein